MERENACFFVLRQVGDADDVLVCPAQAMLGGARYQQPLCVYAARCTCRDAHTLRILRVLA